jgi:regulator of protease activity HflC (stomatin/prohibitin superfamily)
VTPANPRSLISDELHETSATGVAGGTVLSLSALASIAAAVLLGLTIRTAVHGSRGGPRLGLWVGTIVLAGGGAAGLSGLTRLAPGDAVVIQFFGRYVGSLRVPGLWWVHPWTNRRKVSTKVRTHETPVLKVNDTHGVPIEIAMIVNWRVSDTARALFVVENYPQFVGSQCDMALRHVAASHPYEPGNEDGPSLSTSAATIGDQLLADLACRVEPAGISVVECQIVHIAYAPEVAHAMLRRQQAAAIVAARQQIVEGAVGMVELALHHLGDRHVVDLDEERKATMVSNLLVVLCSDHATQPIVNAGSLYH